MESAGARLKKIRIEKGITLEAVQKKTKIHLNILRAIEGDGLSNLSPVYLKGFTRIYCKFLGVDPKDFIENYKEVPTQPLRIIPQRVEPAGKKEYLVLLRSFPGKLGGFISAIKTYKKPLIIILIIVVSVFGLFQLGKVISAKRQRQRLINESLPRSVSQKTVKKEKKAKKEEVVIAPKIITNQLITEQVSQPAAAKKELAPVIRLSVRTRENCWVDLKVDGKTVFRRVLERGRFETWEGKNKIELSVGNAQAVELEVNGQLFRNLGRRGQALKNIVITKEGLNIGR